MDGDKIRAIVKRADEEIGHVTNISNRLKNLQNIVGGDIEIGTLVNANADGVKVVIICKECGRLHDLPLNCCVGGVRFGTWFFGDIIVTGAKGEDLVDLPKEFTRKLWSKMIGRPA